MRLIACPDCAGGSVSQSKVGGICYGGCEKCGGSGLVVR